MAKLLNILLLALLAASTQAGEPDPDILFDAVTALSRVEADTQEYFVRITGIKNISYRNVFTLEGASHPAFSLPPTQQSLSAKIEGKLEGGYSVRGEIFESDIGIAQDRAALSIKNRTEELSIGDLTLPEAGGILPMPSQTRGARLLKRAGLFTCVGLVSVPEAVPRVDRMMGNGTQGPYRLSFVPIMRGSERIKLIKGMEEKAISADAYRMDYDLGTLTFERDVVEEDYLIEIAYLQQDASDGSALTSLKTSYSFADSASASVQIVRAPDSTSGNDNTYTSWGFRSASKPFRIQTDLALLHANKDSHQIAGSTVMVGTELDRFKADARYVSFGEPLSRLGSPLRPHESVVANAKCNVGMGLAVFSQYAGKREKDGSGTRTIFGFSAALPYSSEIVCERTDEKNRDLVSSQNSLTLSKKAGPMKISTSASSGTEHGIVTKNLGSSIELSSLGFAGAKASIDYLERKGQSTRLTGACDINLQSGRVGSATLSCRLAKLGDERTRRIVSAECRTLQNLPIQVSGKYDIKCLNSEEKEAGEFLEMHELSGSARIKLAQFNLVYYPQLSLSGQPELSQHRIISLWSPNRILSLEVSAEDSRYRKEMQTVLPGQTDFGFDRRMIKTGARITPNPNTHIHLEYETDRSHNIGSSSLNELGGWRARMTSAIDRESSLQLNLSDFRNHKATADSGTHIYRDRSIEAKASREMASKLTAYIVAGVTRRDELDIGYSYSPGVGLRLNTGGGTTGELSYRTTRWLKLPGRDEEKAALQINSAERWFSGTCELEYRSLTRPIAKTFGVSLHASLHF